MGLIYRQGLYGHAAGPQQSLYWIEKAARAGRLQAMVEMARTYDRGIGVDKDARQARSEEHTSELQSLMRTSYAVFCLKKTQIKTTRPITLNEISPNITSNTKHKVM